MLAGSSQSYSQVAHHNIHFGKSWRGVFDELIDKQQLMSDPSVLVTNPTRSDPSLAPPGKEIYYVLFPTPNLSAGIDWDVVGPRYRDECVARLEGLGYVGFGDAIEIEDVTTPADWGRRGMEQGAPFAAATASSRPARSGRTTWRRRWRASCSPARARSPASACRWCW
jgi:phytoene desaturase